MEYRPLGKTGVKVSPICLGTAFRSQDDEDVCIKVIHRAIDLGCNFIDTALYGAGRSEQVVGKALKGKRDDIVLTTKVFGTLGEGPNRARLSRLNLMTGVEASLQRLQTDHIDLYLLHSFDPETPLEETLRALDDIVRQGKARYIGCSNFKTWKVMEALWISSDHNWAPFSCIQSQYNLLNRFEIEPELMPLCKQFGIGIMTYSPLAVGLLTGQFRRDEPLTGTWAKRQDRFVSYMTDQADAIIQTVVDIAKDLDATAAQIAIAWLLNRPNIVPILGPDHPDQVDDVFGALEIKLSGEHHQKLDAVSKPMEIQHSAYLTQHWRNVIA